MDNAGAIEDAAISFQKDYEEYDCDYDWAMKEALKQIGLKRLELIFGDEKGVSDAGVLHWAGDATELSWTAIESQPKMCH